MLVLRLLNALSEVSSLLERWWRQARVRKEVGGSSTAEGRYFLVAAIQSQPIAQSSREWHEEDRKTLPMLLSNFLCTCGGCTERERVLWVYEAEARS